MVFLCCAIFHADNLIDAERTGGISLGVHAHSSAAPYRTVMTITYRTQYVLSAYFTTCLMLLVHNVGSLFARGYQPRRQSAREFLSNRVNAV